MNRGFLTAVIAALGLGACGGAPAGHGGGGQVSTTSGSGGASTSNTGGTSSASGGTGGAPAHPTIVRVHYPAGGHTLSLRGSAAPLDWDHGLALQPGADDTWTVALDGAAGALEVKPLLDDATWSLGPNYVVPEGAAVDLYPRFTRVAGDVVADAPLASAILGNTRAIHVYLPPTYLENARARFPVVYMHDGQNLFDPSLSFAGVTWRVRETMDAAALDGSIAEAIVVGVDNTDDRMNEYTPWADPAWATGGEGDAYLRMLVEELKPRVDAAYRTLPGAEHSALVGSSLGGIISAYGGVTRADVFGLVGALSPTTWWGGRALIAAVGTVPSRPARALRVYVDSGDAGTLPDEPPNDDVLDTKDLADAYRAAGYVDGSTLRYVVQAGGTHDEEHWAERLPGALAFLLGPRAP
jgi:predicted alpha/beta superfamily hydrolase